MSAGPDRPLTAAVLEAGTAAGLAAVGVADAAPFETTRVVLEERRAAGLHGGMAFTYRNPARSTDPSRSMAGARSLVVGAWATPPPEEPVGAGAVARVARYAATDHYGRLREALGTVADLLRAHDRRALVLADDNALVDRAAAHRAGLGWFGKNANLLLPGRGSWFVLGSVLTDAHLEPAAAPVADGCGTCRRCLDGCPTDAIVAPGVVDARRCLAWLVQAPGPFPPEFRAELGDRIYGCDDCQEVCPPNRRAEATAVPVAMSDPGPAVELRWLLTAPDHELLDRVGRWYIPARDPAVLRRNALVVLGNTSPADAADGRWDAVLRAHQEGDDPLLAEHAAWAATRLGRPVLWHHRDVPHQDAPRGPA
ncbi:MAG: tRNA epoxyqueuosine(34) reductase QueG [Microthrixaceae bacterium]